MASSISSYFRSPAPTSQLEAPSEIQQSIDFLSDRTAVSIQDITSPSTYEGLDWTRLRGFEMPPIQHKRHRQPTSFIWRYGWHLHKQDEGLDYWICKLCHIGLNKPSNPFNFSYICTQATSSPIEHLKLRYRLAAAERNTSALSFDAGVFRGLITRMFIEEQLPLSKVESPTIRNVLIYLNPRSVTKELQTASTKILGVMRYFDLEKTFSYVITDNASENQACLNLLAEDLAFDAGKRHVLCIGHVINLIAYKVLFGSDVESFEHELEHAVTAEAVELATWCRKGPISKLHNLICYILHSSERQDAFLALQSTAHELSEDVEYTLRSPLRLIRDNVTRWNSWYDAAVHTIELCDAINEFTEAELADYRQRLTRYERRSQVQKDPPKPPSIFHDKLHPDDWHVIATYVAMLKPSAPEASSLTTPPTTQPPGRQRTTRRGQRIPVGQASASAIDSEGGTTPAATQVSNAAEVTKNPTDIFAESQIGAEFLSLEHHFTHNINTAWQKLEYYYNLSDNTPIYRVAVFLHPKLKWLNDFWSEYKATAPAAATSTAIDEDDEWSLDDQTSVADQLWLYQHEPHSKEMSPRDSLIEY
ncbi:hypothetical protein Q7P36_010817 [Cladosporium allicinum]